MIRSAMIAMILSGSALFSVGCAAPAGQVEESTEIQSEEALTSGDKAIVDEFKRAVRNLTSNGGEGDAEPLQVITVDLRPGDTMDFETLTKRIAPQIPDLAEAIKSVEDWQGGASYDFEMGESMSEYWKNNQARDYEAEDAEEEGARIGRWHNLERLSNKHFTKVVNLTMGVTYGSYKSIETGAVAQVLVGKLSSGKLLVIYGIDIWT